MCPLLLIILISDATGIAANMRAVPVFVKSRQWTGRQGRSILLVGPYDKEGKSMTGKELADNLTFLSAMQMLAQLINRGLLSQAEADEVVRELKGRLRPTLISA